MLKYLFLFTIVIILFIPRLTAAQAAEKDSVVLPQPEIGWEKFDSLIAYPPIALRAGLEGLNFYTFEVDTLGNAVLIGIESESFDYNARYNTALLPETVVRFRSMFPNVKWFPAKVNGKAAHYIIKLPVFFYIKHKDRAPLIIKESNEHIIEKDINSSKRLNK